MEQAETQRTLGIEDAWWRGRFIECTRTAYLLLNAKRGWRLNGLDQRNRKITKTYGQTFLKMKTIKKAKEIKRVTDLEAAELVKRDWNYCPKSEWKKVRDKKPEGKKSNKKKSK